MVRLRHIFLGIFLLGFAYALVPPPGESKAAEAREQARSASKYKIRIAPGAYMPGTRPQNVGEPLRGLKDLAAKFKAIYPDTDIEFVDMPASREWLVTQLMGEQAPDVININVEDVWQDVQKGWYIPLDKYLEAPNPFVPKGQPGSAAWWDLFKYQEISRSKAAPDGKMYCVTYDMIETGIFYNKDIFRKLDLRVPQSWPEFLQLQQRLQSAGYTPMMVDQTSLADWGVDLIFDQLYREIRLALDVKKDPLREDFQKGYLDWDELAFLNSKGFFTREDPRWRDVFRIIMDWRRFMTKDFGSVNTERAFLNQQGAMYWSSSFTVNKLLGDPDLPFEWGVFYLPPIPKSFNRFASGIDMCVIGEAATQFCVTNSAITDTKAAATSERLKRVIAFLQFMCLPEHADQVINEIVALMPNIVGVQPDSALEPFARILEREYTTTKWLFTFDLRFNDIMTRSLYLYLQGGMEEEEFMEWMEKNVQTACDTIVRRKDLDLSRFEAAWEASKEARRQMEGLPNAARP